MAKKSAPMFVGKHLAECCVHCGEEFNRGGLQVYVLGDKQFCSLNCIHQYKREELLPELTELEASLIKDRKELLENISYLKMVVMMMKGDPNVSFRAFNSDRHNGKADTEDPEEQEMFETKKNQIIGSQLLMIKNIKARNASAYHIFKGKFQEQYEEYIAITKNSEQRVVESRRSMEWLKAMEICERHFIS